MRSTISRLDCSSVMPRCYPESLRSSTPWGQESLKPPPGRRAGAAYGAPWQEWAVQTAWLCSDAGGGAAAIAPVRLAVGGPGRGREPGGRPGLRFREQGWGETRGRYDARIRDDRGRQDGSGGKTHPHPGTGRGRGQDDRLVDLHV